MPEEDDRMDARAAGEVPVPGQAARRIPLSQIIGADREVLIDHDGQIYRLRVTSKGKLILTK